MRREAILASATLTFASAAFADTAYVKPSTFSPTLDQTITVEVSFSDFCCEPRYAVRTDTYSVIGSDGSEVEPDRLETFSTTTLLEHTITQPGTTRFTTGERLGRKGEYVQLDGKYHLVNSPDAEPIDIPDGTPILSSQTATVTDAYVTSGAANWDAIRARIGRLAIEPAVHPSSAMVGASFFGRVTFDGEPVADRQVILTNEMHRLNQNGGIAVQTDNEGLFSVILGEAGTSLLMVRLQAPAPENAETNIRSYTTALTINVQNQ